MEILYDLLKFIMDKPGLPVIVVGDLNVVMDKKIDRFPPGKQCQGAQENRMCQYLQEAGLSDIWRLRNPGTLQYSCYSSSYSTLSRIDIVLGNDLAGQVIQNIEYQPRGVSDHSLMTVEVNPGNKKEGRVWKLNPAWLEIIEESEGMASELDEFIRFNSGTVTKGVMWDTLKAYLRGLLIQKVYKIKKASRDWEDKTRRELMEAEKEYVKEPLPDKQKVWEKKQQSYKDAILRKVENKRLFQRQIIYGEGEKVGKMLASIVKNNSPPSMVSVIRTKRGEISSQRDIIIDTFKEYYTDLYKSRGIREGEEMDSFFSKISIPVIEEADKEELEQPITLEEIKMAVAEMANNKSPGPDGLPTEIYKSYGEILLPELLKVFNWAKERGKLPPSMTEAIIIVLHKEGKDPLEPGSYRPISLLCSDVKILAKVLAGRLRKIIHKIVHQDQTGFIPNRATSMNIRRVFLNLQIPTDNMGSRAVMLLDVVKAFDSVEWEYIWRVLREFGFGPSFISWVKVLYNDPKAKVRINGDYSSEFQLERGSRQGCPLSPLIFALAMEPLAISMRQNRIIKGFQRAEGEERIALYADDVLIFLGDLEGSLNQVLEILSGFGRVSGLSINQEKSVLLPIDPVEENVPVSNIHMEIAESTKYLGIKLTKDPGEYLDNNLNPLLRKFKSKIEIWRGLPLSVAGRCNLIKMLWLPQLLYVMHNSPIWISRNWFKKIDTLMRDLIWKGRPSRIGLQTLQLSTQEGGLAVPHPRGYFLAAQMQQLGRGSGPNGHNRRELMIMGAPHGTVTEVLEANSFLHKSPTIKLMKKVWNTIKDMKGMGGLMKCTPLWNNKNLEELKEIGKIKSWEMRGINKLSQLYNQNTLKTFGSLKEEFGIPDHSYYSYQQIKHALSRQFGGQGPVWNRSIIFQKLDMQGGHGGSIAEMYPDICKSIIETPGKLKCRSKWEEDLGVISDEQWKEILAGGHQVSVSPAQKVSQLMLLHRTYYTPKRLFRFGGRKDDKCPRCQESGDLMHMIWKCPKLFRYWNEVVETLNKILALELKIEPKLCILGVEGNIRRNFKIKIVRRCLFQARKLIALRWQARTPPHEGRLD